MENDKPDLSKLSISRKESDSPTSEKYWRWGVLGAVALAIIIIIALFPKGQARPEPPSPPPPQSQAQDAPTLHTSIPSSSHLDASGYVVAQRKAAVASKATGRIKELRVEEGDKVKKDDIIAILENEDLVALVAEREAFVESQRTRLKFAQAELDDARLNRDRYLDLRKKAGISQSELDTAQSRFKKAESDLAAAVANVNLAQAQLEKVKVDLSFSIIRAPFDGTVLTKNADIGEVVAPFGSSTNARAAVVTMADMSSLQVEADVSEQHLAKLHPGLACSIHLDSYPDKEYRGVVSKIVPTVDRAKGTVLTKIKFLELDSHVLPDMSAKVSFSLDDTK